MDLLPRCLRRPKAATTAALFPRSIRKQQQHIASTAAAAHQYPPIAEPPPFSVVTSPHPNEIPPSHKSFLRDSKPFSSFLTDNFNRQHDYLRISITERCNLRCTYCMPEEGVPLSPASNLLTSTEISYLSSLFVSQGVTKIRLTGGEPTIRKDIVPLMHSIGALRRNGLKELCLTTNGIALHRKVGSMAEAGLTGVNLSLDTLDPFQFQIMTRRKGFDAVIRSIDRILEMNRLGAGIKLKINCVVMRGINEREILPFVDMGREKDVEVRFIEYMPFDGNKWSRGKMLSYKDMLAMIREMYPGLEKVKDHANDTSKTYRVPGFVGRFGFITSMTENFCGSCNRLRITSDGNLKVCLFGNAEVSLRDLLRKSNGGEPIDEEAMEAIKQIEMDRRQRLPGEEGLGFGERERELLDVIEMAVKRKKEKHAGMGELENMKNRPMILIGDLPISHSSYPSTILQTRPYMQSPQRFRISKRHLTTSNNLSSISSVPLHFLSPALTSQPRLFSTNPPLTSSLSKPLLDTTPPLLPHLTPTSEIHQIEVGHKVSTHRTALAIGHITFSNPDPLRLIRSNSLKKGDVLAVARVAGIMAVKKTSDIVPLAHGGVGVEGCVVRVEPVEAETSTPALTNPQQSTPFQQRPQLSASAQNLTTPLGQYGGIRLSVLCTTTAKTGVEMEALCGVMGAALSVVDMVKGIDRGIEVGGVKVAGKKGGRSGAWGVWAKTKVEGEGENGKGS